MNQPDFFPIPSPCIGVCEVNNKGYCKGCLRNRDERQYWQRMSDDQKHHVMRLLSLRRAKIRQHKEQNIDTDALSVEQFGWDF